MTNIESELIAYRCQQSGCDQEVAVASPGQEGNHERASRAWQEQGCVFEPGEHEEMLACPDCNAAGEAGVIGVEQGNRECPICGGPPEGVSLTVEDGRFPFECYSCRNKLTDTPYVEVEDE